MCPGAEPGIKILQIEPDGTTETTEHYGSATIIVEENSAIDKQRSAYYVETAPIHSMIIEHGIQIISMPLGADVNLALILQDSYGRSFARSKYYIITL